MSANKNAVLIICIYCLRISLKHLLPEVTKILMQGTSNLISITSRSISNESYKSVQTDLLFGVQGTNPHLPQTFIFLLIPV